MTGEASWPLQQAIYARLSATPAVAGATQGIFDTPPQKPVYPFIHLDGGNVRDWSATTFDGQEHRVLVHVWSAAPGQAEVKALMAAVYDALNNAPLAPAGHQLVNLRFEFAEILFEADPALIHAIMRFRAVTLALVP
ncbi:MAG: DUF3168 domain-containing protein [Alphaproteobacteria bacterium]|nr:MAG: DUF3168 domain-containing protein [Alphaproteobacteria bacterium]